MIFRTLSYAFRQKVVRGEIEQGKGTRFDPAAAEIMLEVIDAAADLPCTDNKCSKRKNTLTGCP